VYGLCVVNVQQSTHGFGKFNATLLAYVLEVVGWSHSVEAGWGRSDDLAPGRRACHVLRLCLMAQIDSITVATLQLQ
jgi:hypothetical protein